MSLCPYLLKMYLSYIELLSVQDVSVYVYKMYLPLIEFISLLICLTSLDC